MIGILINYLTQKFQTFNYLQSVYGLAGFEDGDNKFLWVYQNTEKVILNLDTHQSCSLFLTNGKVDTAQEESQLVANEYNVVKKYPFKALVYIQGNEDVNCITESQKIADSIQKSITGRQKQILASTQLTDAYIEVTGTNSLKEEIYKQYYSNGGLQEKDILVEIEFEFVVSGNQNCFVDSPCSDDEYIFSFDAPQTFCERVDACLDIPTADGQYVLDITGGVKSWSEYSPTGAVVITKTLAQFLALADASNLQFPATYKITDVQNGMFVETLSANTFKSEATLSFLAPDYTLHAQYHSTDGAIANGATVTWGGFYWTNISGGAITPDLPNEVDIDTDLTQFHKIAKSEANGYLPIILSVLIKDDLTITSAKDNSRTEIWLVFYAGLNETQFLASSFNTLNSIAQLTNNVFDVNGDLSTVALNNGFGITIYRNKYCSITTCSSGITISNCVGANINRAQGALIIDNITMSGNSILDSPIAQNSLSMLQNGSMTTSNDGTSRISACTFDNNCQLTNFILNNSGVGANQTSAIFDVHCHGNIRIDGLEIVSSQIANFQDCEFWLNDFVENLWLKGDQVFFKLVTSKNTHWDNCKLEHDNSAIDTINASNSTINWSVTSGASRGYQFKNCNVTNSSLTNAQDFDILNSTLNEITIDFTGWNRGIQNEIIDAHQGSFSIQHNFTTSPLNSGSSVLYNFIPEGARVTSIQAIGNSLTGGGGATLAFGLETDAPNLIAADTLANVNSGKTYSGFSAAATANRSLAITAGVANVTGGSVTVRIELIV